MPCSVLLIEDDSLIGQGLQLGLQSRGFTLCWRQQGEDALNALQAERFDVIVLDLGLPDIDGMDVLRRIRQHDHPVPVIVLTARDGVPSRVAGLDGGADDYVVKPVSTDELAARIRAVSRRQAGRFSECMKHGPLTLDLLSHDFTVDNVAVNLTPTECLIVKALLNQPGQVVTLDRLISIIGATGHDTSAQAIQVHVHSLRKKLGKSMIQTIRGTGYRLRVEP